MGILLYSKNGRVREERLVRVIHKLPQGHPLEIYHTINGISKRFRQPRGDLMIMVLLTGMRKDLIDLLLVKDLFFDIPTVLILPDNEKETINEGLKMIPRYMSYGDGTFEDIKGVLEKMFRQIERRMICGDYGQGKGG